MIVGERQKSGAQAMPWKSSGGIHFLTSGRP
jgi:hypothetical protein